MSFFKILQAVAAIWPLVIQFVQQIETTLPEGTPGADKLAAVKAFLQSAWATVSGIETTFEQAWPTLQGLINTLVALYNSLGLFKHK